MSAAGWQKARRRTAGVVFLLVFALLIWLSISLYQKRFTAVAVVTLRTDTIGNELHMHADVKVRGVVVGEVRGISATGAGAELALAIQPDKVPLLPANVSAELLPTSLFGERYVQLLLPTHPDSARLAAGSVISQDRSTSAIELEQVFRDLLPLLQDVQPQKLAVKLSAVSQALQGRGTELGQTLVRLNTYLQQVSPQLPALDDDITQFAAVADDYARSTPDILQALSDFTVTSATIAAQRAQLAQLFQSVTASAATLTGFLQANADNIIRLSIDSKSTLNLLARYSPEYPCVFQQLVAFEPAMDKALGKGTNQPGLHVTLKSVPSRGAYVPGRDTPAYHDDAGPHCYAAMLSDASVTGPNSPAENEFVDELAAPITNVPPAQLPGWSSELLGPLYRGSEVSVG
jgi:phospholipid/cholesterol/gamma-HCH transport system substrate-binding protein